MTVSTYDRVLDQLVAAGFTGRLSPYCMNEPLLDRRLPDLVTRARMRLPDSPILLQTNGDALKVELGVRLLAAGVNRLIVNVYDRDQLGHFRAMAGQIRDQSQGVRRVGYLGRGRLTPAASQIQVRDCTVYSPDTLTNRAGNVDGSGLDEPLALGCDRPFEHLTVRYNGDVVLCPCDWKAEVVLGNLVEASLDEVWHGPVVEAYRSRLRARDRNMKLCDVCDYKGSQLRDFRPGIKLRQIMSDVSAALSPAPAPAPPTRKLPVAPDRRVARVQGPLREYHTSES